MKAPFIFGLAITFFLLVPLGIYTNNFPFCAIGLTGTGLSLILFSLKEKNGRSWKGTNRLKKLPFIGSSVMWIYRIGILGLGGLALFSALPYWADSPAYINKNYTKLEGIPSKIVYDQPSKGEIGGAFTVIINNKRLSIAPNSHYPHEKNIEGQRFLIKYLPNTDWVMDYKIERSSEKN
jgi:hypothetical protein